MAVAIGLFIFAAVIGSHGFLWWSCRAGAADRLGYSPGETDGSAGIPSLARRSQNVRDHGGFFPVGQCWGR
jgi:hypothetical protein